MNDRLIWNKVMIYNDYKHYTTNCVNTRIPFSRQHYQVIGGRGEGFLAMAGHVGVGTVHVTYPTLDEAKAWCETRYNDESPEHLPPPPANPAGRQLVWSHPRTETTFGAGMGECRYTIYESDGDVPGEVFEITGLVYPSYPDASSWQASIGIGEDGPTKLGDGDVWVATLQEAKDWCEWVRLVRLIRGSVAMWDAFRGAAVKEPTIRLIRGVVRNSRMARDDERADMLRWQSDSHANPASYSADVEGRIWQRRRGRRYSVTHRRHGVAEWTVRHPGSGGVRVFSSAWAAMVWCRSHHWIQQSNSGVRKMLSLKTP